MKTLGTFACMSLLLVTVSFQACAGTFTGRIAVKGNMPFTYLALSTGNGDMKIVGSLRQKLWDCCQGRRVTVRGSIVKESRGFLQPPELEDTEIVSGGE
jgi:hypothetical protein